MHLFLLWHMTHLKRHGPPCSELSDGVWHAALGRGPPKHEIAERFLEKHVRVCCGIQDDAYPGYKKAESRVTIVGEKGPVRATNDKPRSSVVTGTFLIY